jgi:hypothetical protein
LRTPARAAAVAALVLIGGAFYSLSTSASSTAPSAGACVGVRGA